MDPADRPPLRSFKPRRRRLGEQARAAYEGSAAFRIAETGPPLAPAAEFGRIAPLLLEIGFGGGEAILDVAESRRDLDVIGVEVHQPGIARVLVEIGERNLTNLRVVEGDALVFLERVPSASLAEVRIWFPDPWPRVRHQKRRIVRPEVVATLVDRLGPDGVLRLATDWADYAEQMAAVAGAEPRLDGGLDARPARPETRFEARARAEGRAVTDFTYRRVT